MTRHFSKMLVTGGAGFIGSHTVDRLLAEGFEVTVLDDLSYGRRENLCKNSEDFHFVKGDIRDSELVEKLVGNADAIFHYAALVSPALSLKDPLLTNDVNVVGTLKILKASVDADVKKFVFASSAAVYGNVSSRKITEEASLSPMSPYGVSKLACECYAKYFYEVNGFEVVSLRFFNAYGPRQNLGNLSPYSGVISIFLDRVRRNIPPTICGDGEQTRDFVFVNDIVEASILALKSKKASGGVLNIGSGVGVSINKVAATLKSVLKKEELKNLYVGPRPGDIRHSCADIDKARRILGYKPKFSLNQGLKKLTKWYEHADAGNV